MVGLIHTQLDLLLGGGQLAIVDKVVWRLILGLHLLILWLRLEGRGSRRFHHFTRLCYPDICHDCNIQ
jgi:hypothetical protein